ncbi:Ltp family lipoprotein [Cereibacter sphaeroides]|uniref:Ltp family lipoprotein n=1 Tax=Cereibacter sphaeroides TaxID=1063 RepID=UPI001F1CCD9E|nr:Ltp family lipoprotein [Cereibacter sphaeroides]MCE6958053.1 Ltp family lipoprotein [Cereibacter sphaeroides]MCE6971354.1 Ltp family lipoprotein [Cereibacter sphaeroides]
MLKSIGVVALSLSMFCASAASAQDLTRAQTNAARSAKNYLSLQGFSRDGLIDQLSSSYGDGYDVGDATAAVDSLSVDWNEQAARSASKYLEMMGFSCRGLIEQLSSDAGDQYTPSQARYGAEQAGAC